MASVRERRFENLLLDTENSASLQQRKALTEQRKVALSHKKESQGGVRDTPHNEQPVHKFHATGYDTTKRNRRVSNRNSMPVSSPTRRKKAVNFERKSIHPKSEGAGDEEEEEALAMIVGEEENPVVIDSTPLQRTLEELTNGCSLEIDDEHLQGTSPRENDSQAAEGTSLAERVDDALDSTCVDLGVMQALLVEIQATGFRHASVASLEMKCSAMEEAVGEADKELQAHET